MTTITRIKPIDFSDKAAVAREIENFANTYAYADIEHALEISPTGIVYKLTGTKEDVNSEIVGKDALKGSISIHNHPVPIGENKNDSFSFKDLRFTSEHMQGRQYLVSGERYDAFEFTKYYSKDEIETAWNKAWLEALEIHWENGTKVIFEHEDILKNLNKFLEGFKFYENL